MRCKKHYTDLSSINGVCATSVHVSTAYRITAFLALLKSKKNDFSSDPRVTNSSGESATSSTSWFSIKSRRNKQPVMMRKQFCPDRGLSPERYSDCDSGYESCQQTPWRTPVRRVNSTSSGLTFCLSPLVRASPCRNWNHNAAAVTTVTTALDCGDVRGAVKPHFCANRSRKLADFGRLNPNR
nr:hypothetical protein [Tanacetum cinerariifolium]